MNNLTDKQKEAIKTIYTSPFTVEIKETLKEMFPEVLKNQKIVHLEVAYEEKNTPKLTFLDRVRQVFGTSPFICDDFDVSSVRQLLDTETTKKALEENSNRLTSTDQTQSKPEEFRFVPYQRTLGSQQFVNKELNKLADWCDAQYEKVDKRNNSIALENNCFETYASHPFAHMGIKFNSGESATMFIKELNKVENEGYKQYFIRLLKEKRL